MKKRLLSLFLILAVFLSLTACNTAVDVDISSATTTTTTTTAADSTTSPSVTVPVLTGVRPPSVTSTGITPTTTTTATATTTTTTVTTTTTAPTASAADKALVDRAFGLAKGDKIEGVTLTGIVTDSQGYNAGYGNATFDLAVEGTDGQKTIYCYRVKPADTDRAEVAVGDRLSLTGTIQNYKGTIEFYPADYTHLGGGGTTTAAPTTRPSGGSAAIDEDGVYQSKEDVALYLYTYGKLPKNFVTKDEWKSMGKPADKCCGGDRFYNKEGQLPNKAGRLYYECDIDSLGLKNRNAKRIVYSNDGLIYYTGDHYATFTLLYGEP